MLCDGEPGPIAPDLQIGVGRVASDRYPGPHPLGFRRLGLGIGRGRFPTQSVEEVSLPTRRRLDNVLMTVAVEARRTVGDGTERPVQALMLIGPRGIEVEGRQKLCAGAGGCGSRLAHLCKGGVEIQFFILRPLNPVDQ